MPLKVRLAKYEERADLKSLLIIKQLQKEFVQSLSLTPNVEHNSCGKHTTAHMKHMRVFVQFCDFVFNIKYSKDN